MVNGTFGLTRCFKKISDIKTLGIGSWGAKFLKITIKSNNNSTFYKSNSITYRLGILSFLYTNTVFADSVSLHDLLKSRSVSDRDSVMVASFNLS